MGRMTDLILVGDEAWTPEEWERYEQQRERERERKREYSQRPEVKERRRLYFREYGRRRRAKRPYAYLSSVELDEKIDHCEQRLERLLAERMRRRSHAA